MKHILLLLLIAASFASPAQNTVYFMERLPQKLSFNPAFVPDVNFYIGLPGIGGITSNFYNSGFNYNELDNFMDNLSDPNYNPDEFVNSIGDINRFSAEIQANILSFGFKTKKDGYFSFNIAASNVTNLRAASDIAYLLADLNDLQDEDFPITIDNLDLITNTYLTYSFSYSRKINDALTVGISPKLNFNQVGVKTNKIGYRIEMEETEFDKDYTQNLLGEVLLGMPSEINPDAINGNELDLEEGLFPDSYPDDITVGDLHRNASFSMDIGGTYTLEKWFFSASILNIGQSTWRKNAYLLNGDNETIRITDKEKIRIGIPAKLYLGAMRQFSPRWNYGLMLGNTFFSSGSMPSATVSLNGYVGSALSTSVSYTAGYKFDNLGLGLRLRFFPGLDLFMVTDNIIQAFNYKNAYRLTAAFGINFAIGVNEEFTENLNLEKQD